MWHCGAVSILPQEQWHQEAVHVGVSVFLCVFGVVCSVCCFPVCLITTSSITFTPSICLHQAFFCVIREVIYPSQYTQGNSSTTTSHIPSRNRDHSADTQTLLPTVYHTMAQYSFPILSTQEVQASLSELDWTITEAQLTKPTYDIVRAVYEHLVTLLMGITRYGRSSVPNQSIIVLYTPCTPCTHPGRSCSSQYSWP